MSDSKHQSLKLNALSGMMWKFFENIGMQMVQLIIQIVLARILMPEEYGLIGLLTIFISISDIIITQGLTTALIQKKNAEEVDFSSVFYANLIVSFLLYTILFFASPLIADFYHEPILISVTRVLSLNVIIGAVPAVHNAILSRNLEFKKSFYRNIANVITQGIVGIYLAYMGFGVWALVFSKVIGTLVGTIVICITVRWYPKKYFNMQRIKSLFSYSSKVLGTNLLNTIFNNIHSIIIGRYFTAADLGYYQRGQQIPHLSMGAVDSSMSAVLYPTFSKLQDNLPALKNALRRAMKLSMFLVLPILFGVYAISEPLTIVLLTEKWLPSVPFMKLACIATMFWPLAHRNQALNAIGRSNITLKLSIIGKTITIIAIIICIRWGIYAIMLGSIISLAICTWISSYYVSKYIGYTIPEFILDILPPLLISLIMCIFVSVLGMLEINLYIKLIIQILIGIVVYTGCAFLFRLDSIYYSIDIIKSFLKK